MGRLVCLWLVAVGIIGSAMLLCGAENARYNPRIRPGDFVAVIDNPYFPLVPGTTLVYEGKDDDGEDEINKVYVTRETKEILGVTCVVVRDTVIVEGDLAEETLDWFAQHRDGTVWYFGEDSKDYEDGKVVSTEGSWEAGVDRAKPGIVMQAHPRVGEAYRQEYYKGEAEDMAEVLSLDESVTVPYGSFDGCLKTKEWTPLQPGVVEHKYYARGVGMVSAEAIKGEAGHSKLVEVTTE